MTPKELREKTLAELNILVADLKEEHFRLKMQQGTGQLEKSHRLGEVKQGIARALTIRGEKERQAAAQ